MRRNVQSNLPVPCSDEVTVPEAQQVEEEHIINKGKPKQRRIFVVVVLVVAFVATCVLKERTTISMTIAKDSVKSTERAGVSDNVNDLSSLDQIDPTSTNSLLQKNETQETQKDDIKSTKKVDSDSVKEVSSMSLDPSLLLQNETQESHCLLPE
jgi:hypothetical protein